MDNFQERLEDLLKVIDYQFSSFNGKSLAIKDLFQKDGVIDVFELPYELVSDDHLRKLRVDYRDDYQYMHVQSTKKAVGKSLKGDIDSYKVSSFRDSNGEEMTSFTFFQNGFLFEIKIGKNMEEEFCHYRMKDMISKNSSTYDIFYTIQNKRQNLVVSKSHKNLVEEVIVNPNGVLLKRGDTILENISNDSMLDSYLMSALSGIDQVIEAGNKGISSLNPELFTHLQENYPFFSHLLYLNDGCVDADLLDSYFQKHHFMIDADTGIKK